MRIALGLFPLLIATVLVYAAYDWRAPMYASIRYAVFAGLVLLLLALIAAELWSLRSPAGERLRVLSLVTLLTTMFALVWTLAIEARFQWIRHAVLSTRQCRSRCLARHFGTDRLGAVPRLMENQAPFVMLGHVRLTALDTERPASFSPAVIGLLRRDWRIRGVLITDDATMGTFYGSAWGITGGALQMLNAGVDLILISHDPDQYFPVMYGLLQAARSGALRTTS